MVNKNGNIESNSTLETENRGFNFGDAIFETVKLSNGKLLFWEDHYFRLMASMRIMRMEIPMSFTLEYFEDEVQKLVNANAEKIDSARVKIVVYRVGEGLYSPSSNEIEFLITLKPLENAIYTLSQDAYCVDLYKDNYVSPTILSTLKTNNKALNILGSIYAKENGYDNCLLLNTSKSVVESLNSNLFLVKGNTIKTPPLTDGCLKGVMRKQIIDILKKLPDYEIIEDSISPFELQKADELFLTNVIVGIQSITNYRKKSYSSKLAKELIGKLNLKVRLS